MVRTILPCLFLILITPVQEVESADHPFDLTRWRLTLPIDKDHEQGPDEIYQPELNTFADPQHFFLNQAGSGVVFRAHCGGSTTRNSSFPRCEFREMTGKDENDAKWNTSDKTLHTMTMKAAITATPKVKKHVVCAQIHAPEDDLLMIRLEGEKLFIERNDLATVMLERRYKLGTPFDLKIQAGKGTVEVWYNGKQKLDWNVNRKGCYFKAGCYTQSNLKKGDKAESYGEVIIYYLELRSPLSACGSSPD